MLRSTAFFLALAVVAATPAIASSPTGTATWRTITYEDLAQPTISVPVGLLTEMVLEPGEIINDGLNADPGVWEPHVIYSGDAGLQTPHLSFRPSEPGRVNVIITTNRRTYRFMLVAQAGSRPVYVRWRYAAPVLFVGTSVRPTPVPAAVSVAPTAAPTPDTALAPADAFKAACTDTRYQVTGPVDMRPAVVCNDGRHTYIRFAVSPDDVPVLYVVDRDGSDEIENFSYLMRTATYKLDGVPGKLALVTGVGKSQRRVVMTRG